MVERFVESINQIIKVIENNIMKITKVSQLTGKEHTMDIDVNQYEMIRIENRFHSKELIQNIVPNLSMSEREFLMTGITSEEWDTTFGEID
jgi:hypothetical protein